MIQHQVRFGSKMRRTQCEHMFSALPSNSDMARCSRHVSKVPNADIPANSISRYSTRQRAVPLSRAHILPHHPGILVFEDVTVIHEGMFRCRWVIKGNQKFGLVLDENHVLPPRQMSRRWCARERQNAK